MMAIALALVAGGMIVYSVVRDEDLFVFMCGVIVALCSILTWVHG